MSKATSDGLARVQSESRIPASTWREWCSRLELDPSLAVEVWDEVCNPMRTASGQPPDLTFIVQLRATRADSYIDDFRDELPSILLTSQLLEAVADDDFAGGRGKAALMRLYRHLSSVSGNVVTRPYLVHVGCLLLMPYILPGDLTFRRLVRSIADGKSSLDDLLILTRKKLPGHEAEEEIIACFDAGMALLTPPSRAAEEPEPPELVEEDSDDAETDKGDVAADAMAPDTEEDEDDTAVVDEVDDDTDPSDDDDNEAAGGSASLEDIFVTRFGEALALLCEGQGSLTPGLTACLDRFDPFHVRIPSMEEARRIAARVETGRNAAQRQKSGKRPVLSAPSKGAKVDGARPAGGGSRPSGGGGISSGGVSAGGGGRSASPGVSTGGPGRSRPSATGGPAAQTPKTIPNSTDGAGDSPATSGSEANASKVGPPPAAAAGGPSVVAPELKEDGHLAAPRLHKDQLNTTVKSVSNALSQLEATDPRAWQLFCEPDGAIEAPKTLAEELATEGSAAATALGLLRVAAQQQLIKPLPELPVDQRMKGRRFDLEAQAWLNAMTNNRRELDPDARQLIPLPKVLDHAAAGLLRLEALRTAVQLVQEAEDVTALTPEMVSEAYEAFLGDVSYRADHDLLNLSRPKADADAAIVLDAVAAEAFIDRVSAKSLIWVRELTSDGAGESADAAEAAAKESPMQIENAPPAETTTPLPDDLLEDALLGGIVEALRQHVLRTVWPLLAEKHRPEETARGLDVAVRRELRAYVRMAPRRERHQKNPKVALPVTSLERLTGNPDLGRLFIRLSVDGKMLYIEDYEDGNYIDVFELHKNTKRQMHARAKDHARAGDTGELQTGFSYLTTLGRTNRPCAQSEAEIKTGFVRTEEREPMIFSIS